MFHPIFESLEKLVPIPQEFRTLYDEPFAKCIECECDLTREDQQYLVERIFRGTEPIIEYAICPACHKGVSNDLSDESLETLQNYFSEHFRLDGDSELIAPEEDAPLDRWLGKCKVKGIALSECKEYQIIALCQGDKMVLGPISPFMISGAVMEEAGELLSKETRDRMDDFVGSNFGMPSEFCDFPKPVLI